MSVTITAIAEGSPTLRTEDKDKDFLNGDFLILRNPSSKNTGDGSNEETLWMFYFQQDREFNNFKNQNSALTKALLTLELIPNYQDNQSDGTPLSGDIVTIDSLPFININEATDGPFADIRTRLPDLAAGTIQFDLLKLYGSDKILGILFNKEAQFYGRIPMRYFDDALIFGATLELIR